MPSSLTQKDDLWSKLRALRTYTVEMGFLHQSQIDQLKLWGRLAFQQIPPVGVEIAVDFALRDVKYTLKGGKLDSDIKRQATLVAGLDRSIAEMLGDEWRLLIDLDGKNIYTGQRRVTPAQKTNAGRKTRSARTRRRAPRR